MEKEVEGGIAWHALSCDAVIKELKSNKKGLGNKEAKLRLERFGKNEIKRKGRIRPLLILLSQFNSFFIFLLVIAAGISALLNHWIDFYVIMAIVIVNASIGFFQNYKAENSIRELRKMLVPKAKILRNNVFYEIHASEVVPGDILILQEGDKIVADARLIEVQGLQVNEAILTGESVAAVKFTKKMQIDVPLVDRENIVYSGTSIVLGSAKAVVFSTGMNTEFGKIAFMVQKVKQEKTPLQKRIDSFAKKVGLFIIFISVLIGLIGFFLGMDKFDVLLTSISLAVAAVPEGLPAVITICLAIAVQRMFKQKSLIRTLPSAETLGRVTVICSDKTGTITSEKMTVTDLFYDNKLIELEKVKREKDKERDKEKSLEILFKTNCLCNNARIEEIDDKKIFFGDPTEKALLRAALDYGFDKRELTAEELRIKEFAFSSSRKLMSIIRRRQQDGKIISYVKGAPDVLIERCSKEIVFGKIQQLTQARKKEIIHVYEEMASSGLRVLGFAFKELNMKASKIKQKDAEQNLVFIGFEGMMDPPRPEVRGAIKAAENAGIVIKIITGDSLLTAKAVANKIGLMGEAINVDELERMSDSELKSRIDDITIFARISPEHKLRIINILKEKKEIVAVTGDGVNDAPALKAADIGIAMGIRGSDVARETSNIILIDDNFASIVKGVKEGRIVYDNIKKSTKFLLGVNFSELMIVLYSIIMRLPLPLLPLQILWTNLVTDSLPALALSVEKGESVLNKKPIKEKSMLQGITLFLVFAALLAFIAELVIFHLGLQSAYNIEKIRTLVLTTGIIFEMFFIFTCRSNKPLHKIGIFSNKYLTGAVIIAIMLQIILIYSPLGTLFGVVPLTIRDWMIVIPLAVSGIIIFEVVKIIKEKRLNKLRKR